MDSSRRTDPADARAVLHGIDDARERLAQRIVTPWWYRLGAAACTAAVFGGGGLLLVLDAPGADLVETGGATESTAMLLVLVGAVVAPGVLLWALRRSTGMSIERYAEGLGPWYAAVLGLFVLAFALQAFAGVPHAVLVGAAGTFVATLLRERHLDALLRRRVGLRPDPREAG